MFFRKQAAAAALGFAAMIFMANFNYKNLKFLALPLFAVSNILLILIQFVGDEINGKKRWFDVPIVGSVQPSEIAKIGLILAIAFLISRKKDALVTWKDHFIDIGLVAVTTGLVLIGNLGTAIIVFIIGFGIVFIASPYIFRFVAATLLGAASCAGFVLFGESFRFERIQAWLNPENYADGVARQALQSMYAIGSGGLFGAGPGQSTQKMGFISEAHNDFIFAIICEELGFMGAILVLGLFAVLIWRGIKIAKNAADVFGALTATGIVIMIAAQVIMNVAVVTNTIPTTGVPLPLISYGGSSLAITMFSMGILLNISRFSKTKEQSSPRGVKNNGSRY
jgi:cell division protein FtsW